MDAGEELSGFIVIDETFSSTPKGRGNSLPACGKAAGPSPSWGLECERSVPVHGRRNSGNGFDILWTAFEGSGSGYEKLKGQDLGRTLPRPENRAGVAILTFHDRRVSLPGPVTGLGGF